MLGLLDTTVNGPAPTGFCLNAFSPILSKDVFDAIQFRFAEMNDRLIAANGAVKWISTVSVPDVVTAGFSSFGQLLFGLHVHGDASERSKFHLTVSASNGLPSVNFTPGRSLMVNVLPSEDSVELSASSPSIFPPSTSLNSCP